jgi:hypothetical protein
MAFVEDMFKGNAVTGVAIGLAAIVLGPTVLPAIGRVLRPAAKSAIKGGIVAYRAIITEAGEFASDLIEEARSELEVAGRTAEAATAVAARSKAEHSSQKH